MKQEKIRPFLAIAVFALCLANSSYAAVEKVDFQPFITGIPLKDINIGSLRDGIAYFNSNAGEDVIDKNIAGQVFTGLQGFTLSRAHPDESAYDISLFVGIDHRMNRIVFLDSYNMAHVQVKKYCLPDWLGGGCLYTSPIYEIPTLKAASFPTVSGSSLNTPMNITTDYRGHFWVTDVGNNRVIELLYDPQGTGADFSEKFNWNGTIEDFSRPFGVCYSPEGNGYIFVTDTDNDRIVKIHRELTTDRDYFYCLNKSFKRPQAVVCGNNSQPGSMGNVHDIYVADTENNRIVKFYSSSSMMFYVSETSIPESDLPHSVVGLVSDLFGNIYAIDKLACKIYKFSSDLEFLCSFGQPGETSPSLTILMRQNPVP